jgi:cation:H+ antiporter
MRFIRNYEYSYNIIVVVNKGIIMLLDIGILLGLLIGIVFACSVFTNAIEWLGEKMNLSAGAVGSVLAAVGTALPETIVPIIAILAGYFGNAEGGLSAEAGSDIGIGAILGAPFMLGTLAMFISGAAVIIFTLMKKRGLEMHTDVGQFYRDKVFFLIAYILGVGAAFIPGAYHDYKWVVAVALLGLYGLYLKATFSADEDKQDIDGHDLDALMFAPKTESPTIGPVLLQTAVGLGLIIVFAHAFVHEIHTLADRFHLNALILSLIVIPIATELPEKFNSVVWLSKKKDTLAMGNLTGAMVFQSCIPVAVGVAFTPWVLNSQAMLSVGLCLATSLVISALAFRLGKKAAPFIFLLGGISYAVFVWMVAKPLFS